MQPKLLALLEHRFRLKRGSTCKQHSTARSRKQIYLKAFGATYETYYSP